MADDHLQDLFSKLTCQDRHLRRKVLQDLKDHALSSGSLHPGIIDQLVLVAAKDTAGNLRENASIILLDVLSRFDPNTEQLRKIIELACERFATEPIEEVRLSLARLLRTCITKTGDLSDPDSIVTVTKSVLKDQFADVFRQGCGTVRALSEKPRFSLMSDYLLEPLLEGLKRRQTAVRVDCAGALSPVLASSYLKIPEAAPRLFRLMAEDDNPQFQLALVSCVGQSAIKIGWENQYVGDLLPILLVGSCHEYDTVRREADTCLSTLKEQSCGKLLKNLRQQLLKFCLHGLDDWTAPVRKTSAILLFSVIQQLGRDSLAALDLIMELITHEAGDSETVIVNWATKSAELMGQFCATEAIEWLNKSPEPNVKVFTALLKGSQGSGVDLGTSLNLLERLDCSSNHKAVIECVQVLLRREVKEEYLDRFLILLLSVGNDSAQTPPALTLLEEAAHLSGYQDVAAMMHQRLSSLWKRLSEEDLQLADATSRAWRILNFAAHQLKSVDASAVHIIHQVLSSCSSPEVQLKSFNLLTTCMPKLTDCSLSETGILAEIRKKLKWKAGRASATIRSSAALCIWSAMKHQKVRVLPQDMEDYAKLFVPLLEDEVILTRLTAVRLLTLLFDHNSDRNMDDVFNGLIARTDDISREVRREAMSALHVLFFAADHPRNQYRERFIKMLTTYSADDDPATRQTAQGILESMQERGAPC